MDVLVAELTPKTDLCSQHILLILIPLNNMTDMQVIEIHPSLIVSIGHSQMIANTHVKVEGAILRYNYGIFGGRKASTPPVHNISWFKLNKVVIHPIHE
jgi:hypothetical protein